MTARRPRGAAGRRARPDAGGGPEAGADRAGTGPDRHGTGPGTGTAADPEAATRSAVRAFIRAHHPDVGGDPDAFVAGLARLRAGSAPPSAPAEAPPVVVPDEPAAVRLARYLARLLRHTIDPDDDPRPASTDPSAPGRARRTPGDRR